MARDITFLEGVEFAFVADYETDEDGWVDHIVGPSFVPVVDGALDFGGPVLRFHSVEFDEEPWSSLTETDKDILGQKLVDLGLA
jgi:hypothetical protein